MSCSPQEGGGGGGGVNRPILMLDIMSNRKLHTMDLSRVA